MHLRQGETVAVEGGIVDRCFMIEYGSVEVRFLYFFLVGDIYGVPLTAVATSGFRSLERYTVGRYKRAAVVYHSDIFQKWTIYMAFFCFDINAVSVRQWSKSAAKLRDTGQFLSLTSCIMWQGQGTLFFSFHIYLWHTNSTISQI